MPLFPKWTLNSQKLNYVCSLMNPYSLRVCRVETQQITVEYLNKFQHARTLNQRSSFPSLLVLSLIGHLHNFAFYSIARLIYIIWLYWLQICGSVWCHYSYLTLTILMALETCADWTTELKWILLFVNDWVIIGRINPCFYFHCI